MKVLTKPFIKLTREGISRPWLPIIIVNPHTSKRVKTLGLIDTGADECALPSKYAELLGHSLKKGKLKEINTGNGKTIAYSHTVKIEIPDFFVQETLIDFMPNLHIPLIGVRSFLSNFILTVNYSKQTFSLSK
ncbi:MAG: retroviral-like aspartic protease family protein [Elusimicrobia bacterium]|nr:retroviral-like aspartic protease family protein [Elusimicrobiota bacterium]